MTRRVKRRRASAFIFFQPTALKRGFTIKLHMLFLLTEFICLVDAIKLIN